jgi:hypothetical protein
LHETDPPLRPSDPEAFRRHVYRRAAKLRRRRVVTAVIGTAAAASAVLALVTGSILPLTQSAGERLAIGTPSTSSSVATTQTSGPAPSSTAPIPTTTTPSSTQVPMTTTTTTIATSPTTTPTTVVTTPTTIPATTVTTSTTTPPTHAVVPGGCGQPAVPAAPASPADLERDLVATWIQCTGPSVFGPYSGTALEILANGTWHQLGQTPGGYWEPLNGNDDAGTWQILQPAGAGGAGGTLVRFVSAPAATTVVTTAPAPPQIWTARVALSSTPPERAQFVEGTSVANYLRLVPAASNGSPMGS